MKTLKVLSKFELNKEKSKNIMGGSEYPPGDIVIGGLPYCIDPSFFAEEPVYIPFHEDCMCLEPCPL